MEHPSEPEKSSPEGIRPTFVRPPGLEFAMGIALFAMILMVFFLIQSTVFIHGVLLRSPDIQADGFSFELLKDPRMEQRMNDLVYNGDLVAMEALWSGLVCTLLIVLTVFYWKRRQARTFLGLRAPHWKHVLIWFGAFLMLGVIIELLAYLSPSFRTDFMERVIGSTSNVLWLYLGVGVMAPVFEEFLLRGLLFGSIRHMVDEHATVALTAGVFTLMHMQYDPVVMLLILPMGIVLGYSRSRSGSIWVPIILHTANNMVSVMAP
ncbi:MAG: CPBP family intramembrane metalloprotease [Flavobacteriales bacterium]|nr:CPBP family intramembrane metalloprotease [Flavobacteriales bacterium]